MSKNLSNINLIDLLPSSISEDKTIQALASAVDYELKRLQTEILNIRIYSRLDEVLEPILSHLAWAFQTPYWDENLPKSKKIELLKNTIPWHKKRGTAAVVEQVISTVLSGGQLLEWWEYGGAPYHFKASTTATINKDAFPTFYKLIKSVKNKRSVLDSVIIKDAREVKNYTAVVKRKHIKRMRKETI